MTAQRSPSVHGPLSEQNYCVIEFLVQFSELVGIQALKINTQGKPLQSNETAKSGVLFQSLIRPRHKLSTGALRFFNIENSAFEAAPALHAVYEKFHAWLGQAVFVNRLSAFELHALGEAMASHRLSAIDFPVLDPFYMARYLHPRTATSVIETLYGAKRPKKVQPRLEATGQVFGDLLRGFIKRGKTSLDEVLPHSCPKPVSRAYTSIHQVLHDAFLRNYSVLVEYPRRAHHTETLQSSEARSAKGSREDAGFDRRRVDIFGFRAPFMVGFCHMRKAMRTFRMERIRGIQLLEENPYRIPEDFSLGAYFMSFHPGARDADQTRNIHFR